MRFSWNLVLTGFAVFWSIAIPAATKDMTPMEKLCAGYERKQDMLQRRLNIGARSWEKEKIQAQLSALAADRAKHCSSKPKQAEPTR